MEKMTDFKVHAVHTICNLGGIGLMLSDDGSSVRYQWFDNKPTTCWQPIKYSKSGRPYVRVKNRRYYLDEFIRVNN